MEKNKKHTGSQQGYLDYVTTHFDMLNLIYQQHKKELEGREKHNFTTEFINDMFRIQTRGEGIENRVATVKNILMMLPANLHLESFINTITIYRAPYWIKKDSNVLLYENKANFVCSSDPKNAIDAWHFMPADIETAPSRGKYPRHFYINLYSIPAELPAPIHQLYEEYIILKQFGLAVILLSLHKASHDDNDSVWREHIEQFRKLFQKESIAVYYNERFDQNTTSDNYLLDAWSDCFAAYFMGHFILDDASRPWLAPDPFSANLEQCLARYMYKVFH